MRYFPLSPRKNYIRLLVLHPGEDEDPIICDLVIHDLDHPASRTFYALSYTWGDSPDSESIILKDEEFHVRPNLKAALKALRFALAKDRKKRAVYIWIDAICINQADIRERSEQVLRMPDIYQAAETTVIWLGEATDASDKAMDFMNLNEHGAYADDPDLLEINNYREEYLALTEGVLTREWWQRIWIVQEVTVSNNLVVLCGDRIVTWKLLIQFLVIAHEYHMPAISEVLRTIPAGIIENSDLGIRLSGNRIHWRQSGRQPLHHQLTLFRSWRATNPCDKVYGVLGMVVEASDPTLKPNYDYTPQTVFKKVTRFIIEHHKTLNFVLIATGNRKLDSLPSWTPDLTVPGHQVPIPLKGLDDLMEPGLYFASKDATMEVSFSADNNILHTRGVEAGIVAELAPYWNPHLSTEDFESQLISGTSLAWHQIVSSHIEKIISRYGPGLPLVAIMGKLLTADRQLDIDWKRTRFAPEESFIDLPPIEAPPDSYQAAFNNAEQRYHQWRQARKLMVEGTLTWRRFMVTNTGYIGIVPMDAKPNDVVCVLFGCDTPVVLRPKDESFELVGECYVYGIMDGELVDAAKHGGLGDRHFAIE